MSTGSELRDKMLGNIGDRSSGQIGSRTVAEVGLDAVNAANYAVCKRYNTEELKAEIALAITATDYRYAYPVVDSSGNTIRVKSFDTLRLKEASETTGRALTILPDNAKRKFEPIMDSSRTARPTMVSLVNHQIEFYPWPDAAYTVYAWVNKWPTIFNAGTIGNANEFEIEWEDSVEAYGTYYLFKKLQQTEDAALWYSSFLEEIKLVRGGVGENGVFMMDGNLRDLPKNTMVDYARDPLVGTLYPYG